MDGAICNQINRINTHSYVSNKMKYGCLIERNHDGTKLAVFASSIAFFTICAYMKI